MKILRAEHLGMCFGVRDAIALAKAQAAQQPVTILGQLVHNESVLADLRQKGVRTAEQLDSVTTPMVLITAHGTSQRNLAQIRERGFEVFEATCPLVKHAHNSVMKLARAGYHPVIIGQRNHVEVRGLTGDLDAYDVVLTEEDIAALPPRERFGVASQTTQPIARVRELVAAIKERFPQSEVRFVDTVCQPTKQRQQAAEEIAQQSDVVVVVGGANSNNTKELVNTCWRFCPYVHHVQGPADLKAEWFAHADVIGLTAGTSTPDDVIDAVEARLHELTENHQPNTQIQQEEKTHELATLL
ncbi:MAG: (E)-4-hydroxy-3-methyl-but-2-enyl pyrophosphate reductase [Verrucomicrobia bacterium]|jgi:4-hydroxy-3-methylbut-2-enyl diphosphate reductase|nr:(E)-4-hydroxy-3-methyl-but-2-enyl pyrophosphate reductase [Verrucomicrobiota bacterium]